jgi:mono/diheme cytochrome c family protein
VRNTTGFLAATLGLTMGAAAFARVQDAARIEMSAPGVFKTYCASCHGAEAKGDGPVAHALQYQPADLTLIASHAQGRFEKEKVCRIIDGRSPVKGHGGPDMPVWGDAFKRSGEGYSEEEVKARIESLAEYLETLQAR